MTLALNIVTIIMSILAVVMSMTAIVMVLAQKWSTHRIEWKPLVTEAPSEETEEDSSEDEDFLQDALRLNKKKKKEDPLSDLETSNF